jgi:DNA-binding CsgD family transcriptional regulator
LQRAFTLQERFALRPAEANDNPPVQRPCLTPTEADIARRLTAGHTLAEICEALDIRESTIRTHVRHLFQKTQTRRQAELVAYLLRRLLLDEGARHTKFAASFVSLLSR